MADNKKSVIFYVDWATVFDKLDEVEAGRLVKHFLDYIRDKNPEPADRITEIAFESIKQQLKRDLKVWEEVRDNRVSAGQKGGFKSGEARRSKSKQHEANEASASQTKQSQANEAVNVTVNVNDTVTVTDSVNEIFNIKIGLESFQIRPSEILKKYQKRYETMMQTALQGINEKELLNNFDKEYSASEFNDMNHFFNSLKKTGKDILNPKQNGYKQETTSTPYREKI